MSVKAIHYSYAAADGLMADYPVVVTDPGELLANGGEQEAGRRIDLVESVSHPWDAEILVSMVPVLSDSLLREALAESYVSVAKANSNLRELKASKVPDVLLRNARQRLQEAVNALFGPMDGSSGLGGLICRELVRRVGQRQTDSFRSVMVPGPELRLDQCGVPKEMLNQGIGRYGKVLLNRAPTLHQQNLQTLSAVPEDSKAIRIHPMACYALDSDFDGDQAAVYGFASEEAAAEAEDKMSLTRSLFLSRNGDLIIFPTQEMVYGLAYMTSLDERLEILSFDTATDAMKAHEEGRADLRQPIRLLGYGESGELSSVGRLLFALEIPRSVKVPNIEMNKPALRELLSSVVKEAGPDEAIGAAERLMRLGFRQATASGISIGLGSVPPELEENKEAILSDGGHDGNEDRLITKFRNAALESLSKSEGPARELLRVADSGARGNRSQLGQLFGARGFMAMSEDAQVRIPTANASMSISNGPTTDMPDADPPESGIAITGLPVFECFADGTPAWAHFASAFGWRRGLVDRWCCDEIEIGIRHDLLLALADIQAKKGSCSGHGSLLECTSVDGVCRECYGSDPATGKKVSEGAAVGLGAAFAVTEPLVQMPLESHEELKGILRSAGGAKSIDDLAILVGRLLAVYERQGIGLLKKHAEVAIGGLAGRWSTGRVFETLTLDGRKPMQALAEAARDGHTESKLGIREYMLLGQVPVRP